MDGPRHAEGTVFFRRGAGSGWTLVGDAGHHKEFVIGDGITEALLQARSFAAAIAQGTDAALIRWWRARDVEALPHFFSGRTKGRWGLLELQQVVFAHAAKVPALRARLAATMEHRLSPTETFPVRHVLWWALGAAFRIAHASCHSSSRRANVGQPSIASCVCVDGFSLRRRPPRHTPTDRHEPGERSSAASRGIKKART